MKLLITAFCLTLLSTLSNAQSFTDAESTLKYPDELVTDKSLMNYTIYKPNTAIVCKYEMMQVSKTAQRTVFISEDSSKKMSFAFFDLQKLPFYNSADSAYESSYRFYSWDSTARVKASLPAITIFKTDTQKGIIYFKEITGDKIYLVGTKNNIVSLILMAEKKIDPDKHAGNMAISYKYNLEK